MNRVYQTAQNVIIWLGTSNDQIDHLFYWMSRLDEEVLTTLSRNTKLRVETWAHHWAFLLFRSNERPPPINAGALKEILKRDWFSRIWVVQEAALARSATIICGRNSVSSRTFVVMPTLLAIECDENEQSRLEALPGPLRSGKNSWWSGSFSQDLDTLLRRFGKSKATDPRDIIYALLGLSAAASTSDILRPDYGRSLEGTVQYTMLYLLHRWKYLNDFRFSEDLPEWNIDQLLFALEELPQHIYTWAVDHGKDTLTSNFLSSREDARKLQDIDKFIRGTENDYSPPPEVILRNPTFLDLMLQHRELYLPISDSSGPWLFMVNAANRGGTALSSSITRSNEVEIEFGHLDKDLVIFGIPNRASPATVDLILNDTELDGFALTIDVHKPLAVAARNGAHAFMALQDRSARSITWARRKFGFESPDESSCIIESTMQRILCDVSNGLTIHAINGETECLRAYLDAKPDLVNMRWRQFRTPLGFAAEANNAATVTLLLDRGADIESRDWQKPFATPLWIAASQGHIETVQILVLWGADMEVLAGGTGNHCTPLWIAASRGFKEVVLYLADMGADINFSAWDSDRVRTAVGIAASKLHIGVLRVLAEKGADMGELDEDLRGQLHIAAG